MRLPIPLTRKLVSLARDAMHGACSKLLDPYAHAVWELPYDPEATTQFLDSFYRCFDETTMPQALLFVGPTACVVVTSFAKERWDAVQPMLNDVVNVNRCFNVPPKALVLRGLNDQIEMRYGRPNRVEVGGAYAAAAQQ